MTPEQLAKAGTEHAEQTALFCWAALNVATYPELRLMFAIPNGGERNKIVAANLKAEGVKSSVPDILLPVARGPWHGFFIELKRRAIGKQRAGIASEAQLEMIAALKAEGYAAMVCVGWEIAAQMLIAYLAWSKSNG